MKKYIYLILGLSVFMTSSCQKKTETDTCSYSIYYLPFGLAFEGFTTDEVDTLILKRYDSASNFTVLEGLDTLYTSHHELVDNIIFRNPQTDTAHNGLWSGFGLVTTGSDYILTIPALQSEVRIKEISPGPESHTFQVDGDCSPGSREPRFGIFNATFESPYQVSLRKGRTGNPPDNIALIKK